jgi:hypothetical protein
VFLSKPFCYDSRLILGIGGIRHLFESVDPLARQCFPIPWKFHQIPSSICADGVHLQLHCKFATCSIRSLDSFSVYCGFTGIRKEQAGRESLRWLRQSFRSLRWLRQSFRSMGFWCDRTWHIRTWFVRPCWTDSSTTTRMIVRDGSFCTRRIDGP